MLESKTHNIKKEERERERERNLGWDCCYEESKTCKLCFIEFVSPRVNLNHINYFFEGWYHLVDLNHISNAFVKQIKIKNKKNQTINTKFFFIYLTRALLI